MVMKSRQGGLSSRSNRTMLNSRVHAIRKCGQRKRQLMPLQPDVGISGTCDIVARETIRHAPCVRGRNGALSSPGSMLSFVLGLYKKR